MLDLGARNLLLNILVTGEAQRTLAALIHDHLAVFGGLMTGIASIAGEGRMYLAPDQLGLGRNMRIMAAGAIGSRDWLISMCGHSPGRFNVVALDTELWRRLSEVISNLFVLRIAGLVRYVARIATHTDRRMPASFAANIGSQFVAFQAEIIRASAIQWRE